MTTNRTNLTSTFDKLVARKIECWQLFQQYGLPVVIEFVEKRLAEKGIDIASLVPESHPNMTAEEADRREELFFAIIDGMDHLHDLNIGDLNAIIHSENMVDQVLAAYGFDPLS